LAKYEESKESKLLSNFAGHRQRVSGEKDSYSPETIISFLKETGALQVVVEREEESEFFTHFTCSPSYDDCTPKVILILNHWV